jgi:hypothetical protein
MAKQIIKVEILQFKEKGDKTSWTYFEVSGAIAQKLLPGMKKSFRVKGKMDNHPFKQVALIPMGEGDFIFPFNASMRKGTGKKKGDILIVEIEHDKEEKKISEDLLNCLAEEESSLEYFLSLPKGHQNYYSNWVDSAKSATTKSDRIVKTMFAMKHKMDYGSMIRHFKSK